MDSLQYKVCIRCYTYNHAPYIGDAMNGFVMQQTDFPFVATIVDDASTDETTQVISNYFRECFDTEDSSVAFREDADYGTVLFARHKTNSNCYFAVVLLHKNHHSQKKSKRPYIKRWIDTVPFIALCEGDDYWTDSFKLQKQLDYLEAFPNCLLCVHSADWKTGDSIYSSGCQSTVPKDYSVEELIRCGGVFFATASFVYRSELIRYKPDWRKKASVGDFPLQILAGLHGDVHYLPDKMCVYRFRSEGSWSTNQMKKDAFIPFQKNKIEWMTLLNEDTGHKYQRAIYDQLFQNFNALFNLREITFLDYAKAVHKSGQKRYVRLIKDFIRMEFSPLYRFLVSLINRDRHV